MYSWQQFTEDAAIILGGGSEGRKKASEILHNQKVLTVAGGTFLGVVLLYSIRKLYQRSTANPGLRKTRVSTNDLFEKTVGTNISDLDTAVNNLLNMSESGKETVNCTVEELGNVMESASLNSSPDSEQGSGDAESSVLTKIEEKEVSEEASNQNSTEHQVNSSDKIVENGHDNDDVPLEKSPKKINTALNEKLLKYYNSYAKVPEEHSRIVNRIIEDFKYMFGKCCEELMPNHELNDLKTAGSTVVGLQAIKPEGVDIFVPLALDPAHWMLVDAGQAVMSAHGYWLVKRQQIQFFSHGTSKYDKYLTADYLSPSKVSSVFLNMINRVAKWSDEYKVQAEVVGPAVTLSVFYEDNLQRKQMVKLDFIPTVTLDNVTMVAKSHPASEDDASFSNLWRQSFEEEENKCIFAETPQENVAPKCLQIVKAIRKSFPINLGLLNSYVFKNAVLLLLKQEEDWTEEALAERFIDVFKVLETSLMSHTMSHWCCPQQNLLSHFHPGLLEYMGASIREVLHTGQFDGLLQITQ